MKSIKTLLIAAGLMCISSLSHASSVTLGGGSAGSLGSIFLDGGALTFTSSSGFYDLRAASDLELDLLISAYSTTVQVALFKDAASTLFNPSGTFSVDSDPMEASGTNALMASVMGGSGELVGPLYFLRFVTEGPFTVDIAGVSTVPVPAAGILFASALFGAGALGRRKKKNATTSVNGDLSHTS